FASPIGNAILADDDPADEIGCSCTPRGKKIAGHIDAAEKIRPLKAVKIERQGVTIIYDTDRNVGFTVGQIDKPVGGRHLHLDLRMETRKFGEVRHEQACREGRRQRPPQKPTRTLVTSEDARL